MPHPIPFVVTIVTTVVWGTSMVACTATARVSAPPPGPAPSAEDLLNTLIRIEQKIERLEIRMADHDEAMQKACGPR